MADRAITERFRAWLRERNLPVTSQRLQIAELMLAAPGHLSAEDVVTQLRDQGITLGVATVYRTIDLLLQAQLVTERDFGEGFRRFEPVRERSEPGRLTCAVCGATQEFRDERVDTLARGIALAHGLAFDHHQLVITGTCLRCQHASLASDRSIP